MEQVAMEQVHVSLIVRVDLGAHGRLGPGKMLLLERIATSGSISAAARTMNMSYRQAWDLVDQLNRAFAEPVVSSQTGGRSGGGAALTPFGRALVERFRAIETATAAATAGDVAAIEAALRPVAAPAEPPS
jgi:molybdate transport system regulatory protein